MSASSRWRLWLRGGVAAALLLGALKQAGLGPLWHALAGLRVEFFLLGLLAYPALQAFCVLRWRWLLEAMEAPLPMGRLLRWYWVGMFANLFLPTLVGGDAVRIYLAARWAASWERVALSVLLDRFLGFVALLGIGTVGVGLWWREQRALYPYASWLALAAVGVGVAGAGLAGLWWWGRQRKGRALRWAMGLEPLRRRPSAVLGVGLLALLFQLGFLVAFRWVGMACGLFLPYRLYALFVPLLTVAGMLPISINGLGVREMGSVLLFATVGVPKERALLLSLLWQGVVHLSALPGGWLWLREERPPRPSDTIPPLGPTPASPS